MSFIYCISFLKIDIVIETSAPLTAVGIEYGVEKGDFIINFPDTIHAARPKKNVDVGKFIFNPADISDLKVSHRRNTKKVLYPPPTHCNKHSGKQCRKYGCRQYSHF